MTFRALISNGHLCLVLAIAGLGWGCPLYFDLDSVEFEGDRTEMGVAADSGPSDATTDQPDGGSTDMLAPDQQTADMATGDIGGPDAQTDMSVEPTGEICTDMPGDIGGDCDLVGQACGEDEVCELRVAGSDPPEFVAICATAEATSYNLVPGEACDPGAVNEKCVRGAVCRASICRTYCRLADASGCQPGDFCTRISPEIDEFGVCESSC